MERSPKLKFAVGRRFDEDRQSIYVSSLYMWGERRTELYKLRIAALDLIEAEGDLIEQGRFDPLTRSQEEVFEGLRSLHLRLVARPHRASHMVFYWVGETDIVAVRLLHQAMDAGSHIDQDMIDEELDD